jgi:NAD(P)-dependent dehydrogenase (short-subunit alcohol dehydrogenase family)
MTGTPVAVVTGASGGIGAAIAQALTPEYDVVGFDLRVRPSAFAMLEVDVTDRASVTAAAATVDRDHGRVGLVVNAAGNLTMNRFLDLDDDEWHRVMEVNGYGTFLMSQVFARGMVQRGAGGRIVNVASIAGKTPLPDQAHYCTAKAGVIMLGRVMAMELAEHGVRVFTICPGAVDTELFRQCLNWSAEREGRDAEELLAQWLAPSRLGRFVTAEEISQIVRFLALGPTEAMTGHALSVDGGIAPF